MSAASLVPPQWWSWVVVWADAQQPHHADRPHFTTSLCLYSTQHTQNLIYLIYMLRFLVSLAPTPHLSLIVSPKTAIWGEKLRNLPLIYDSWLACGAPVTTRGASPGCGCFFGHCLTLPCKDHFESPVISTIPKCQGHIGKVRKSVTIAFIIHHTKESWKHTRNAFNVNNAII